MSSSTMASKNKVMIVFGDGRHGHNLACTMCSYNEKHQCFEELLIVVDKSFEKCMDDIKSDTCKILPIDFKKGEGNEGREQMERIMSEHKADWMILLPCGDTCTPQATKNILECYKKHQGRNIVMCSKAKCDEAQEEPISRLKEMEKMVKQMFPKSNTIFRSQLLMADLDFFAEDVKQKKMWRLPIGKDGNMSPISLYDGACALGKLCAEKEMTSDYADKTLTFTNKDKINGERLAEMTRSAFKNDIKFENISREQAGDILKKYLRRQQGPNDNALHRHLMSNVELQTLLWSFQMVEQKKYDFVTEDLKNVIGKEPTSVDEYLRDHEEYFNGRN